MKEPCARVDVAILAVRCDRATTEEPFLSRISYRLVFVLPQFADLPGTSSVCLSLRIPKVDLER